MAEKHAQSAYLGGPPKSCAILPQTAIPADRAIMPLRLPMYFFYRILTAVGMLFLAPYYALRGWRRGEPSSALWERMGSVPQEIISRAAARGDRWSPRRRDLDSCRVGWRSARCKAARGRLAAALSGTQGFRLDDHRDGPAAGARTTANRRWHFLFPARLGRAGASRVAIHSSSACDRDGNRDLAEFPARSPASERARDFRQRAHLGKIVRQVQALGISGRRIFQAHVAGR